MMATRIFAKLDARLSQRMRLYAAPRPQFLPLTKAFALLWLVLSSSPVVAGPGGRPILGAAEDTIGIPYKTLVQDWWKWSTTRPGGREANLRENNCEALARNPRFPSQRAVFFLGSAPVDDPAEWVCTVPKGKPIFVPIVVRGVFLFRGDVVDDECHGQHCAETTDAAHSVIDSPRLLSATLDGHRIKERDLKRTRHDSGGCFPSPLPADNMFGLQGTRCSTVDGFWLLLPGFESGLHTLELAAQLDNGASFTATYTLLVDESEPREVAFHRGDTNGDGTLDIADAVRLLRFLFLGAGGRPRCMEAANANDDAGLDIGDPVFILNFLFRGFAPPPFPGPPPRPCGVDMTPSLTCEAYHACS